MLITKGDANDAEDGTAGSGTDHRNGNVDNSTFRICSRAFEGKNSGNAVAAYDLSGTGLYSN